MTRRRTASGMKRLSKAKYETELARLQRELVKLQDWIQSEGLKVCVIFEGRDAAGKGGAIKRIVERMVDADDKRRARLNCIRHILETIPYADEPPPELILPDRQEITYKRPPLSQSTYVTDHYADPEAST